jgi:UDP-N-acetylglucosamine:LPS N-acetylglucosamine transferase
VTSPSNVRGRAFYFFKEAILVVAQEGSSSGPARLLLLDPLALQPAKRSSEEVYAESFVLIQGGSIYAVVKSGKEYMRNAKLVVISGGHITCFETVKYAKPSICIPTQPEQLGNAAKLQDMNCAILAKNQKDLLG